MELDDFFARPSNPAPTPAITHLPSIKDNYIEPFAGSYDCRESPPSAVDSACYCLSPSSKILDVTVETPKPILCDSRISVRGLWSMDTGLLGDIILDGRQSLHQGLGHGGHGDRGDHLKSLPELLDAQHDLRAPWEMGSFARNAWVYKSVNSIAFAPIVQGGIYVAVAVPRGAPINNASATKTLPHPRPSFKLRSG